MKLLLMGDSQIRDDIPICRTDDYQAEMVRKFKWIIQLAIKENVDAIVHSGDLFDRGRPVQSQLLEIMLIESLKILKEYYIPFYIIPGNHDLPYHSMDHITRSSLGVIFSSDCIHQLTNSYTKIGFHGRICGFPWGEGIQHNDKVRKDFSDTKVVVWHGMVTHNELVPGALDATKLLKDFPEYDLIVTGHNHQKFTVEHEGRHLVNPGSMMRENIDQIDFEPAVWIYDNGVVFEHLIPIVKGVISRDHKQKTEERDEKIRVFIEKMREDYTVGLDFRKNMETYLLKNPVSKDVENLIWEFV